MIETIVSVEESKLEQAWQLACEYDQAVSRQQNKSNIVSRMVGNRRIDSLGRKLCALTHIVYTSDDEQEQLEIMTGESDLLYVPGEDRWFWLIGLHEILFQQKLLLPQMQQFGK